jgi:hypothetical protein
MTSEFMNILKNVGESISQAAPGLTNALPEMGAEFKRLGVQGQAELASLIFQGHGYVPYGPGQNKTEAEKSLDAPDQSGIESPEHTHGGRSM